MSTGLRIRRVAAGVALAASVLAPAGMVLGGAAPASALAGTPLNVPIVGVSATVAGDWHANGTITVGTFHSNSTSGTPARQSVVVNVAIGVGDSTEAGETGVASTFQAGGSV